MKQRLRNVRSELLPASVYFSCSHIKLNFMSLTLLLTPTSKNNVAQYAVKAILVPATPLSHASRPCALVVDLASLTPTPFGSNLQRRSLLFLLNSTTVTPPLRKEAGSRRAPVNQPWRWQAAIAATRRRKRAYMDATGASRITCDAIADPCVAEKLEGSSVRHVGGSCD